MGWVPRNDHVLGPCVRCWACSRKKKLKLYYAFFFLFFCLFVFLFCHTNSLAPSFFLSFSFFFSLSVLLFDFRNLSSPVPPPDRSYSLGNTQQHEQGGLIVGLQRNDSQHQQDSLRPLFFFFPFFFFLCCGPEMDRSQVV